MKRMLAGVLAVLLMVGVSFAAGPGTPAEVEFNTEENPYTLTVVKNTKGFPDVGGWQLIHEVFYLGVDPGCPTVYTDFEGKLPWTDINTPPPVVVNVPVWKVSYLKKSVQVTETTVEKALVLKEQYVVTKMSIECEGDLCAPVEEVKVCSIVANAPGGFGQQFKPAVPQGPKPKQ